MIASHLTAKVLENHLLVGMILKNVIPLGCSILDSLSLRLVSPVFNETVLSIVRQEHKTVTVSPDADRLPGEGEFDQADEDITFRLNNRTVSLGGSAQYFEFLNNVAQISIKKLIFDEFHTPNPDIHEAIMFDLVESADHQIKDFQGAAQICPAGCAACTNVARQCKRYGYMQRTVTFGQEHHFDSLTVSEIYIYGKAIRCAASGSFEEHIPSLITCDHLELVISDLPFESDVPAIHPREIFNYMLMTWKVKRVTLSFLTGFTDGFTQFNWCQPGRISPFSFLEDPKEVRKLGRSFERVDVRLCRAEGFAADFTATLAYNKIKNNFRHLLSVVMRVFPTRQLYVYTPFSTREEELGPIEKVIQTLKDFSWEQDEKNYRHTEIFFKIHAFIEEPEKWKFEKSSKDNQGVLVRGTDKTTEKKLLNWPFSFKPLNSEIITFSVEDTRNDRFIHCEILNCPEQESEGADAEEEE